MILRCQRSKVKGFAWKPKEYIQMFLDIILHHTAKQKRYKIITLYRLYKIYSKRGAINRIRIHKNFWWSVSFALSLIYSKILAILSLTISISFILKAKNIFQSNLHHSMLTPLINFVYHILNSFASSSIEFISVSSRKFSFTNILTLTLNSEKSVRNGYNWQISARSEK